MKFLTRIATLAGLLVLPFGLSAQLTVDNTITVEELVNDYLLGEGVDATNITFNGMPADQAYIQIGLYEGDSPVISFNQGLVMATADAGIAVGDGGGFITDPVTNDPDLVAISGQDINDAAILEFDFVVSADSLKFNYVFASMEYPGYTCTQFNDAFGFFLSGPGVSGPFTNNSKNIALIPGTDIPVAINTINGGSPTGLGSAATCEEANPNWIEDSELYFVDNTSPGTGEIQFPGLTVTLQAEAAVICGEEYHIKMAIGDASDGALDSGVFLEAGSFQAFGEIFVDIDPVFNEGGAVNQEGFDSVLVAGCTAPYIEITRPTGASIGDLIFGYGGTAVEGVDFVFDGEFPTTFPEGVDTLGFVINTINPNITDTLYFELYIIYETCSEIDTIVTSIPIIPPPPILVETEDAEYFCPTDSVVVEAEASNGVEPYSYNWIGYSQGQGILVPIPDDQQYFVVEVQDACEFQTSYDSVLVTNSIPPPLMASIDPFDDPTCPSEVTTLNVSASGGYGEYFYSWDDNQGNEWNQALPTVETPVYIFPVEIHAYVMDECGTIAGDTVTYAIPQYDSLDVDITPLDNNCPTDPVELTADISGGAGDNIITWSITENEGTFAAGYGPNDNPSYFVPKPGLNRVEVEVTDRCYRQFLFGNYQGIFEEDSLMLPVIKLDPMQNVITPNGDGKNEVFVVEGIELFENSRVEIYDRWGRLVYEADTYKAGTEGSKGDQGFHAGDLNDGTYFYIINVNNGECTQSGNLEVLSGKE